MYNTLEEAIAARLDLIEKLHSIEAQLAERAAKVSVGRVPDQEYQAYLEWKARALRAKGLMVTKLARTKEVIRQMRQQQSKARLVNRNGNSLLQDLYGLTKTLVAAGADISHDEQVLLDTVGDYLSSHSQ